MAAFNLTQAERDNEKRLGLPSGLLTSLRIQETGGKQKYIDNPAAYHYGLNAEGKRIAGHTGKISTAFGPYGILESTGAKPGYGVSPLKSKNIEEQVRFAADYVAGRIKSAGSIERGLAGYGEGIKYANSVLGRMNRLPEGQVVVQTGGKTIPVKSPTLEAQQAYAQATPAQRAGAAQPQSSGGGYAGAQVAQVFAPDTPFQFDGNWADIFKAAAAPAQQAQQNALSSGDPWVEFLTAMNQPATTPSPATPTVNPMAFDLGTPNIFAALNNYGPIDLMDFNAIDI